MGCREGHQICMPVSVLLSIRVLSSSCLLRLSLFSISDPTLTLVSPPPPPPPPPLSMTSPSSVFNAAEQFNGDLSAWDVGKCHQICDPVSVLLSIRVLSSSCLLRLSLFTISDPTLTLVSPPYTPPPPLSMSSVFRDASNYDQDPLCSPSWVLSTADKYDMFGGDVKRGEIASSSNVCCPAGTYWISGSSVCTDCSAGKWSDETGLSSDAQCNGACSAGKWSSQTGLSSDDQCQACAAGKFSIAGAGQTSIAVCDQLCSAGKWSAETGLSSDAQCQACVRWASSPSPVQARLRSPCATGSAPRASGLTKRVSPPTISAKLAPRASGRRSGLSPPTTSAKLAPRASFPSRVRARL